MACCSLFRRVWQKKALNRVKIAAQDTDVMGWVTLQVTDVCIAITGVSCTWGEKRWGYGSLPTFSHLGSATFRILPRLIQVMDLLLKVGPWCGRKISCETVREVVNIPTTNSVTLFQYPSIIHQIVVGWLVASFSSMKLSFNLYLSIWTLQYSPFDKNKFCVLTYRTEWGHLVWPNLLVSCTAMTSYFTFVFENYQYVQ